MKSIISEEEIISLLKRQLSNFFPLSDAEQQIISRIMPLTLKRCEKCFSGIDNKYYKNGGEAFFSPFHSGQWLTFLLYAANTSSTCLTELNIGGVNKQLADKIYYLNKIMNGIDIYHEVQLPEIMFYEHPVGTVIGRAEIGCGLTIYQGCTIGGNIKNGIISYPKIGRNFTMYSNSKILGKCIVGDNVTLSANTYVKDCDIPSNSLVFGCYPDLVIKPKKK